MAKQMIKPTKVDKSSVIRFDMHDDNNVRESAQVGYEVSKMFKESGFSFRRIIPAHADPHIRKQFKLGPEGPNLCLEVSISDKGEEYIDEIRDQFLMMPEFTLVNDGEAALYKSAPVHRFLFRPSKIK